MSGMTFSGSVMEGSGAAGFQQSGFGSQTEAARPMSPTAAGSTATCLQNGTCSSGVAGTGSAFALGSSSLAWTLVGVVVAVVAIGAGTALVLYRRK